MNFKSLKAALGQVQLGETGCAVPAVQDDDCCIFIVLLRSQHGAVLAGRAAGRHIRQRPILSGSAGIPPPLVRLLEALAL